jgi:hypothetical protein
MISMEARECFLYTIDVFKLLIIDFRKIIMLELCLEQKCVNTINCTEVNSHVYEEYCDDCLPLCFEGLRNMLYSNFQ